MLIVFDNKSGLFQFTSVNICEIRVSTDKDSYIKVKINDNIFEI